MKLNGLEGRQIYHHLIILFVVTFKTIYIKPSKGKISACGKLTGIHSARRFIVLQQQNYQHITGQSKESNLITFYNNYNKVDASIIFVGRR